MAQEAAARAALVSAKCYERGQVIIRTFGGVVGPYYRH